jgi:tetraprenyl-beta-curcumene synthase
MGSAGSTRGALRALAAANSRYWPTVAPVTRRELARWDGPAHAIGDPELQQLGLLKLRDERFNAEVAATLATLVPRTDRPAAVKAIVALELLFDYLDGRTELPLSDPLPDAELLFAPFVGALTPSRGSDVRAGDAPLSMEADRPYVEALARRTREQVLALPAAGAVLDIAHGSLLRCSQAQARIHAARSLGDQPLKEWASKHAGAKGLGWREFAAGAASSVLAAHALIAAAGDPATSSEDALRIDDAYLAIGAVITILDSVVDESADETRGEPSFIRLFASIDELTASLRALIREALARCRRAPRGEHHAMTLAGVAAYYMSHPGADELRARPVASIVRSELSPTIWPTLGVMLAWRTAKRAHRLARPRRDLK